jgi:ATP-dependent DNA helicase RecG
LSNPISLRELADLPVRELASVGPKLEPRLADMGIETVLDVLQHYPRRWVDRSRKADIATLAVGEEATVFAEVRTIRGRRTRQGRALVEAVVYDGTSVLNITFFNQAWREKQLSVGTEASFFGKLDVYRGKRQMTNPVVGQGRGLHLAAAQDRCGSVATLREAWSGRPARRGTARSPRPGSSRSCISRDPCAR